MQVAAKNVALDSPFLAVFGVIAVTDHAFTKWAGFRAEIGLAAVVLESHQRPKLGLDNDIPDTAFVPGDGMNIEDTDARNVRAFVGPVVMAEQLVAAADTQKDRPVSSRFF